ncbi:sigma-70 family RNA polymerase sigma factor [Sphingomonas koreensis]|nr:sigma-70 family RNA polymerase sigma factor [Sphingomonas koreensis]
MTPQPTVASPHSLEAVYRTERAKLLHYFRRSVGPEIAGDLVQDVFVRAARNWRCDEIECPGAYLRRIARNLLIDRARKAKSTPMTFSPFDEDRDLVAQPEQSWAIEVAEVMVACQRAIDAMSPKTRRVFLMSRVQEASYREIADQLGIGIRGVEYHMTRALSLCRRAVAVRR